MIKIFIEEGWEVDPIAFSNLRIKHKAGTGNRTLNNMEQTFGMKAVGLTFNPSGKLEVVAIKEMYANTIDQLNKYREEATDPEVKRQLSVAITEAQTSQMWAVKALTWS